MNLAEVKDQRMSPQYPDYTIWCPEDVKATIMYISKGKKSKDGTYYTQEISVMDETLDRTHIIYYKAKMKEALHDRKKDLGKEALFQLRAFKRFEHAEGLLCGYVNKILEERTEE